MTGKDDFPYLKSLNEAQKEAVLQTEGPVLVIAGAGAGKTKTIASRMLHLVKKGATPESILAITFTNKAAREMRERVDGILGSEPSINRPVSLSERPWVSTFHALCVHILRENSRAVGLNRHFSIFDRNDSKQSVKEALKAANYDPKKFEPGKILSIISRSKGDMVDREEFSAREADEYFGRVVAEVWEKYEALLRGEKALDFDDLLFETVKLLKSESEILDKYKKRWKYIHVDEYQDTNKVQYELTRLISGENTNIFVVGDIDQTIYTWRGARVRNLLEFERDFPGTRVVVLEENYRSSQKILEAANSVIKNNKLRVEKNLFTKNPEGEALGLYVAYDEADEAQFIAAKAASLISSGTSPREIAVLFRANFQSRVLEEAFLAAKLPYQVLGTRFFERREVKDVLAYLKVALEPENLSDLKRVINSPARGIGKLSLLKILAGKEGELSGKARESLADFRRTIENIRAKTATDKPSETVKFIIKASGLEAEFARGGEEDKERLENVKELASLAVKYDAQAPLEGLENLLADAALASDQDELKEERDAVRLMTVHAAKGLEFDYVFVTGLEEGLFPHEPDFSGRESAEEAEEERRLFYVALTRARKKIFLTYAQVRTIFGLRQTNMPSDFLLEIDESLMQTETDGAGGKTIYLD